MADIVTGSQVLVQNLVAQGVRRIFTIPGAKIDHLLECLRSTPEIELVVCRNEMSAAFMAAGHGRRTGQSGVVLVTSGPGVTNLATGLVTATSEGDPVVAFGGAVPLCMRLKHTHQSMDNVALMKPVTKMAVEVDSSDSIAEVVANSFRVAEGWGHPGAVFVSLPNDIMAGPAVSRILTPAKKVHLGPGAACDLHKAAQAINSAKSPVLLAGMLASATEAAEALREVLAVHEMPVISTFQGTGIVPRKQAHLYAGRVGLIHNQPADKLLENADVVLAVGYSQVEYDASLWNADKYRKEGNRIIIHMDCSPVDIDNDYAPDIDITGSIDASLRALAPLLSVTSPALDHQHELVKIRSELDNFRQNGVEVSSDGSPINPLFLVHQMQKLVDEPGGDALKIFVDMGSFHIWIARYLEVHNPRQLCISNGQQTLGVALPWAISAALDARDNSHDHPGKILSVSGDGGFLFSAGEFETAVRLGLDFVHMVWDDRGYNMVRVQQEKKYNGHRCAVDLGKIDYVAFAEAFGATGFAVNNASEFLPTLRKAFETKGPVLIGLEVDYSGNAELFADMCDRYH